MFEKSIGKSTGNLAPPQITWISVVNENPLEESILSNEGLDKGFGRIMRNWGSKLDMSSSILETPIERPTQQVETPISTSEQTWRSRRNFHHA